MNSRELEDFALYFRCPACHEYGWCVTKTGARARALHDARLKPIRLAFSNGYTTAAVELRAAATACREAS